MNASLEQLKKISWIEMLKRNTYTVASVVILCAWIYVSATAILFVVGNIRAAFNIDERAAESQVIMFDIEGYEKIAKRFNLKN
ncbi:hypothetical protein HY250_04830 [Candidatus Azambacteria bacterium]|nr:hypothetical protein [Candidatus Azambacteria bacterium]MBI3685703.1 hypothetical protein [Candidatus Azambacteria bacterium]